MPDYYRSILRPGNGNYIRKPTGCKVTSSISILPCMLTTTSSISAESTDSTVSIPKISGKILIGPDTPDSPLSRSITQTSAITLPYDQNTFSFTFASLSYQAPDKNEYAYMLEGVDKEWIYTDGKNEASYTNLQPGDYVFRVKGSNNDGLWNTEGSSISLQILPPFWKSSWAYLFYTILILFLGIMTFRSWSKRVKRQHEELLKQYRQQQEKETYQTKINFFTQVAHEIRTPLSLIKMPLESIIQSGDGNEETRKYLTTMNQNTDLLLNLINQLLDFRKTETNEFKLKLRKYNLNELLHNIVSRFAPAAQLKNIALDVQLPVTPYIGCADEEALTKIISNLLSNALKYAHDKIEVTLQTEQEYFEIRVSDNGPGIPRSDRKRIFEIFYQTDNSRGGTGIGLPLAKLLAEKHGGRLYLDEQTQKTTFIIHIPLLQENTQEDDQVKLELLTSPVSDTGKELQTLEGKGSYSILLTEDNTELLSLTAEQLNKYYRILMARNGKEALAILKETNVDLVVSDIMMPEMDGYSRNDGYFAQRQRIYRTSGYRNSKEPAGTYFLYRHTGRNHVYEPFEFLSENQRNFRYVAQRLPEDNPFEDGCRIAFTTRIPDQRNLRIGRVQFFFLFHEMF